MLFPKVSRVWDGVQIQGQQISILVTPSIETKLAVMVVAESSLTGFDRGTRLTGDDAPYFAPGEITVLDTRLECFAADRIVPFYRSGFIVDIEPGMASELRLCLPKLSKVAELAEFAQKVFAQQLGKPIWHLCGEIADVISHIVLDGWTVEDSIAYARKYTVSKGDAEFMAQFDSEAVKAILRKGDSSTSHRASDYQQQAT